MAVDRHPVMFPRSIKLDENYLAISVPMAPSAGIFAMEPGFLFSLASRLHATSDAIQTENNS